MCLGIVERLFSGRQTCLFVFVFMRSDVFHRVVLGFSVDEIFISDVILVHALSSEWMVVRSMHDFTKTAQHNVLVRHMANMLCCACDTRLLPAPLVLTILVPPTTRINYASGSWQFDAFQYVMSTLSSVFTAHRWHMVRDLD